MDRSPASGSLLHDAAHEERVAVGALLVRLLREPLRPSDHVGASHTLLAVCPNSEAVARAALHAAEEANAPLLFAATLNQVDRDGGYTGWTPSAFTAFVRDECTRHEIDVPVLIGLDHGGPWKRDEHVIDDLDFEATMREVKQSIAACVRAGYDLLHLDPTVDRRRSGNGPVPIPDLVDRTIELMRHAEDVRRSAERPPLAYEVGTEEVGSGRQSDDRLRSFLKQLDEALQINDLPDPAFVVGDVGTRLGSQSFDADRARSLTEAAMEPFGALLKGHYTDEVGRPELYPLSGMGGANVGPGLAATEVRALQDLARLESELHEASHLFDAVREAVVESGRWRKWLTAEEEGQAFQDLPDARQDWLVATGSRYVWTRPAVEQCRSELYEHVAPYRDADAFVHWRLKTAILEYMHAFNLINLNDRIRACLRDAPARS